MTALRSVSAQRPLKVLWLTKGLGRGGAEQLVKLCTDHLRRDGIAVEVAYVLAHKAALVEEIRSLGVPVHSLAGRTRLSWLSNLRSLIRNGDYHIVHTHSPLVAAAARAMASGAEPVFIHTEHNVWQRYRWPTYAFNAATYGKNRACLAVSDGVASSIVRPGWIPWATFPQVDVLHHGVDIESVRSGPTARVQARQRLGIHPSTPVVGCVANFTAKKSQRTLLDAFARVSIGRPEARLILVGDGPLRPQLEARASEIGLDDRVLFTGTRDDVQSLLPAFDVFALPSLYEGLPIALLEAMAAGIPPVVTPVGGLPEIITDEVDGYFVPTEQPRALATAILTLLQDERLRTQIGREARRRAKDFSILSAVASMELLYAQVAGQTQSLKTLR